MRKFYLSLSLLLLTGLGMAQEAPMNNGLAIGFHLNQHQNDFGLGLNITSPYFIDDRLAVRLRGNMNWHQHIEVASNETTWSPYFNFSLGVIGVGGYIGEHIRLYGEGGVIALLPSDEFSDESSHLGGYGLFGFEFFMGPNRNYFIELGGMGVGATADKIPGQPIYSNGFLTNVGYRHQF
jgi:hypothetical protein